LDLHNLEAADQSMFFIVLALSLNIEHPRFGMHVYFWLLEI